MFDRVVCHGRAGPRQGRRGAGQARGREKQIPRFARDDNLEIRATNFCSGWQFGNAARPTLAQDDNWGTQGGQLWKAGELQGTLREDNRK